MFKPEVGEAYYSVGPLQHSGIELWEWTNDKYDIARYVTNNTFKTKAEASGAYEVVIYALHNYDVRNKKESV